MSKSSKRRITGEVLAVHLEQVLVTLQSPLGSGLISFAFYTEYCCVSPEYKLDGGINFDHKQHCTRLTIGRIN